MRFHNGLVRMLGQNRSSKMRNHREVIVSDRERDGAFWSARKFILVFLLLSTRSSSPPQLMHSIGEVRRCADLLQSGTLLSSQSASMFLSAADQIQRAGDSLEGESLEEFRFMSSELVPGRCGLFLRPPSKAG